MTEVKAQQSLEASQISRVKDIALRVAGCGLAAGLVSAPLAVQYGLEHAEITTLIGPSEATFNYTGGGNSLLETPIGAAYAPVTWNGIGLKADVELPLNQEPSKLVQADTWMLYAATYNDPDKAIAGYESLLRDDMYDGMRNEWLKLTGLSFGVMLFGAHAAASYRRGSGELVSKKALAGVTAASFAITSYVAFSHHQSWQDQDRNTGSLYAVDTLSGTDLEGTQVDNPLLQRVIGEGATIVTKYLERQDQQNDSFRAEMMDNLERQAPNLEAAREGEHVLVMFSDMHSNQLATEFMAATIAGYNEAHPGSLAAVLNSGDITVTGTPGEAPAAKAQVDLADGVPNAVIKGNHDPNSIATIMEDAGATVLDDRIEDIGGISVFGTTDPVFTPFLGNDIPRGTQSQADVGLHARELALAEQPSIFAAHEGYAVAAFMGVASIKDVLPNPDDYQTYAADEIPDMPVDVAFYGHWHDEVEPRVVYNDDGSWSVVFELGTAGGAIEASTPANFSVPNAAPKKVASFIIAFQNNESSLITGYQRVRLNPDGSVEIAPRTDIGSSDGQPYDLSDGFRAAKPSDTKRTNVATNRPNDTMNSTKPIQLEVG